MSTRKVPWWKGLNKEQDLTVRVIQCDLANHSKWFAFCSQKQQLPRASVARLTLAKMIQKALSPLRFDRLFWRGDGGVFVARQDEVTADKTVLAARALRDTFLRWRKHEKYQDLRVDRLAIRISCHHCTVWAGPDSEYWSSDDLNLFTKFEREIAHPDAIAATMQLTQYLQKQLQPFKIASKTVRIGERGEDTPAKDWTVYYDASIPPTHAVESVVDWFKSNCAAVYDSSVVSEFQRFTIGDSIVLHIPPTPTDSLDIEFRRTDPSEVHFQDLDHNEEWERHHKEILASLSKKEDVRKNLDLEKVSPTRLRIPLLDFPLAKVTYTPILFSRARSFLTTLENRNNHVWDGLAAKDVGYVENAPLRPGIAGAHMLIITNNPEPMIVLAQRSMQQDRETGVQRGLWSASCEETMMPSDGAIENTARRGLEEELLGDESSRASIKASAIFVERNHLSLCVAMVCHTDLSLDGIVERWRGCVDKNEHSQIVGLPLNELLIKRCIEANELTGQARERCTKIDEGVWKNTAEWKLVTTSAFRLALALWTLTE